MQYNINVGNGTGMEVRTNLNLAHQSLATNFFGATDPSLMSPVCAFPGSTWADTGNGLLKVRNADDSDWIVIGTIEADGTPKLNATSLNLTATDVPNTPSGTISATNVQDAINELASGSGLNLRKPSTVYTAGDIAYSALLPSWARLEAVNNGTTGTGELPITGITLEAGQYITDGTVKWIIDDIHDGDRVGDVVFHSALLPCHILSDGATLADVSTEYPRLLATVIAENMVTSDSTDMGKYYYDSEADTLRVPRADDGRFIEGSTTAGVVKNAGLPNIKGTAETGYCEIYTVDGAFSTSGQGGHNSGSVSYYGGKNIIFDASQSNPIYSDSVTTVQPQSLTSIAQIKY